MSTREKQIVIVVIVLFLLWWFLSMGRVDAQELTATPDILADATLEVIATFVSDSGDSTAVVPVPVPVPAPSPAPLVDSGSLILLVFAATGSIVLGGGGLMILSRFLDRKDVQDMVEGKFTSQPPQVQENVRSAVELLDKAADILEKSVTFLQRVTDGLPNPDPAVPPTPPTPDPIPAPPEQDGSAGSVQPPPEA